MYNWSNFTQNSIYSHFFFFSLVQIHLFFHLKCSVILQTITCWWRDFLQHLNAASLQQTLKNDLNLEGKCKIWGEKRKKRQQKSTGVRWALQLTSNLCRFRSRAQSKHTHNGVIVRPRMCVRIQVRLRADPAEPLRGTHHVREEIAVAELLQVQQVGARGRVEFLRRQTVHNRLHHARAWVPPSSAPQTDGHLYRMMGGGGGGGL